MPQPVPISRDSNPSPWPSTATLLAAFEELLRLEVAQGDAALDTVQTYRRLVARYLAWCEATGRHPARATPEEIKAYRWHLVEERRHRPATVALKLTVLRRFYQATQAQGVLPDNPAAGVRAPRARIDTIKNVLSVADVVLIPARPSPHDLRAVATTVEMVEEAGKRLVFVINGATPRTTIAADAVRVLAQHGRVAPVTIHQRIDFAASMIDGRTVGELNPQSRSAQEIADLWKYVKTQISKCVRRP